MLYEITKENFEEVIKDKTIVVDFFGSWCGPCKFIKPLIDKLAKIYDFGTVDIDKEPEIAQKFGIRGVPSFLTFKNGVLQEKRLVGIQSEKVLVEQFFNQLI